MLYFTLITIAIVGHELYANVMDGHTVRIPILGHYKVVGGAIYINHFDILSSVASVCLSSAGITCNVVQSDLCVYGVWCVVNMMGWW